MSNNKLLKILTKFYINITRVKHFDILRTRVKERKNIPNYEKILNYLIESFLKNEKLTYKQGMNEVFGAFVFLKLNHINSLTLSSVYNLASAFIKKFLTNFYSDNNNSLYTLKSSFVLIKILLRYHDPQLYTKLKKTEITPEMYSTSWLLTYFFNKLKLENLFYFINLIIHNNDEKLIFYYIISTLIHFRKEILTTEKSTLPNFFSSLLLTNNKDICDIMMEGLKLKSNTPESFNMLINKLKIFNPFFSDHKELYEKAKMYLLDYMPILTSEVLKICYPDKINCYDDYCDNFLIDRKYSKYYYSNKHKFDKSKNYEHRSYNNNLINADKLCEQCKTNFSIKKQAEMLKKNNKKKRNDSKTSHSNISNLLLNNTSTINYIIIDLKDETNCQFVLPMSLIVSENKFLSVNDVVNKFKNEKGNYHFIVITENTEILQKFKNLNKLRALVTKLTKKITYNSKSYMNFFDNNLNNDDNSHRKNSNSLDISDLTNSKENKIKVKFESNNENKIIKSTLGVNAINNINLNSSMLKKNFSQSTSSLIKKSTLCSHDHNKISNKKDIASTDSNYITNLMINSKISKEEKNYILFYEVMKAFQDTDFPYVSFAYKGFIDIHNKCVKYNLTLANHNCGNTKNNKMKFIIKDTESIGSSGSYINRIIGNLLTECHFCKILAREMNLGYVENTSNRFNDSLLKLMGFNSNNKELTQKNKTLRKCKSNIPISDSNDKRDSTGNGVIKDQNSIRNSIKKIFSNNNSGTINNISKNDSYSIKSDDKGKGYISNRNSNVNINEKEELNIDSKRMSDNNNLKTKNSFFTKISNMFDFKRKSAHKENDVIDNFINNEIKDIKEDNTHEHFRDNIEQNSISYTDDNKEYFGSDLHSNTNSNANSNTNSNKKIDKSNSYLNVNVTNDVSSDNKEHQANNSNTNSQINVRSESMSKSFRKKNKHTSNSYIDPTYFRLNETKELIVECFSKNLNNNNLEELTIYCYNDLFSIFLKIENGEYLPVDLNMYINKITHLYLTEVNEIKQLEKADYINKKGSFSFNKRRNNLDSELDEDIIIKYKLTMCFVSNYTGIISEVLLLFSNYLYIDSLSKRFGIKVEIKK